MSVSALSAGLSGLNGYQSALNISANNLANAQSTGFQPAQAVFQETSPSGSGVNVVSRGAPAGGVGASAGAASATPDQRGAPSGTDISTELVNQLVYQIGFQASAKVIKTADQNLGTLINTTA